MMYELTENEIKQATMYGAKRWTKGDHDRLYLGCKFLGGGYEWKHGLRGKGWLPINGEQEWLSGRRTGDIDGVYIDLKTGKLVGETDWADFVALVDKALAEAKKDAAKRAEKEAAEKERIEKDRAPTMPKIEEAAKLVGHTPEKIIAMCERAMNSPKGQEMGWAGVVDECLAKAKEWAEKNA